MAVIHGSVRNAIVMPPPTYCRTECDRLDGQPRLLHGMSSSPDCAAEPAFDVVRNPHPRRAGRHRDKATLSELATGAEKGCPISNAIRGTVAITVEAQAV